MSFASPLVLLGLLALPLLIRWYLGQQRRRVRAASAFVAPTAVVIGDVEVGEEASIWFGTVIRGDNGPIRIGARTSVQDNSVIHVSEGNQTLIGDDCTIGHCVTMEDCTIENGALVGSNAVVLNDAVVGSRSLIAAEQRIVLAAPNQGDVERLATVMRRMG